MVYTFEYFLKAPERDCGDNIEYEADVTDEQYRILAQAKENDVTHLDAIPALRNLCKKLTKEIEEIEEENMREYGDWTEEDEEEYETDNPFDIYSVVILL